VNRARVRGTRDRASAALLGSLLLNRLGAVSLVLRLLLRITLALTLIAVDPGDGDPGVGDPVDGDPGDGDPGVGDPGDKGMERVLIRNSGAPKATGGCQSTPSSLPAVVLLPLLALVRRRRIAPV
jgi:uncharacterized protein (TIGR03382 family)